MLVPVIIPFLKAQADEMKRALSDAISHTKTEKPAQPLNRALTLQDIEAGWGYSPKTLRKRINAGELKAQKALGKYLVAPENWQAFLASEDKKSRGAPKKMDSIDIAEKAEALMKKLSK